MLDSKVSTGGIVLSRVSKSYGDVRAVCSVDLEIAPGEMVALLGPNGAGKSTTIDMVFGLTRPDQGSISIFGQSPTAAVRAGCVGGMLQSGSPLDHLKVRELVDLMAFIKHSLGRWTQGGWRRHGCQGPADVVEGELDVARIAAPRGLSAGQGGYGRCVGRKLWSGLTADSARRPTRALAVIAFVMELFRSSQFA